MLTEDVKAIVQIIDVLALKLCDPDHAHRLAILRAQLVLLMREVVSASAEQAAVRDAVSAVSLMGRQAAE